MRNDYKLDMTAIYAFNDVLRRDLKHVGQMECRSDGRDLFEVLLRVHHTAEDEALWPVVRERVAGRRRGTRHPFASSLGSPNGSQTGQRRHRRREDLAVAIDFFRELGLELEGRALVEGEWAGRVTGLGDQRVEIAMMRTPDGHGRLELSRFLAPQVVADHRNAPMNALGLPPSDVRSGRHRRHPRPAGQARRAARQQ
jgi:hypothetical protein